MKTPHGIRWYHSLYAKRPSALQVVARRPLTTYSVKGAWIALLGPLRLTPLALAIAGSCCLLLAACGEKSRDLPVAKLAIALGVIDPASPPRVVIDLSCDHSEGSSCSEATLSAAVAESLRHAVRSTGSLVRVFLQGERGEEAVLLHTSTSPPLKQTTPRQLATAREDWVKGEALVILGKARPILSRRPRRSPIAETVARIALETGPPGVERHLVVLTDLREVSRVGGDLECGEVGSGNFERRLEEADVLLPGSLRGISVHLTFVGAGPVHGRRCESTVAREEAVRAAWRSVLGAAGASGVRITSGVPDFAAEEVGHAAAAR